MRLGGLFSGIGGFELAWQRSFGTVAWHGCLGRIGGGAMNGRRDIDTVGQREMCEIDPAARLVREARFARVPIFPGISILDPLPQHDGGGIRR